jgi:hypothetical protein
MFDQIWALCQTFQTVVCVIDLCGILEEEVLGGCYTEWNVLCLVAYTGFSQIAAISISHSLSSPVFSLSLWLCVYMSLSLTHICILPNTHTSLYPLALFCHLVCIGWGSEHRCQLNGLKKAWLAPGKKGSGDYLDPVDRTRGRNPGLHSWIHFKAYTLSPAQSTKISFQ